MPNICSSLVFDNRLRMSATSTLPIPGGAALDLSECERILETAQNAAPNITRIAECFISHITPQAIWKIATTPDATSSSAPTLPSSTGESAAPHGESVLHLSLKMAFWIMQVLCGVLSFLVGCLIFMALIGVTCGVLYILRDYAKVSMLQGARIGPDEHTRLEKDDPERGDVENDGLDKDNIEQGDVEKDGLKKDDTEQGSKEENGVKKGDKKEDDKEESCIFVVMAAFGAFLYFGFCAYLLCQRKDHKSVQDMTVLAIAACCGLASGPFILVPTLVVVFVRVFFSGLTALLRSEKEALAQKILVFAQSLDRGPCLRGCHA